MVSDLAMSAVPVGGDAAVQETTFDDKRWAVTRFKCSTTGCKGRVYATTSAGATTTYECISCGQRGRNVVQLGGHKRTKLLGRKVKCSACSWLVESKNPTRYASAHDTGCTALTLKSAPKRVRKGPGLVEVRWILLSASLVCWSRCGPIAAMSHRVAGPVAELTHYG
jgi:hypothetical protein